MYMLRLQFFSHYTNVTATKATMVCIGSCDDREIVESIKTMSGEIAEWLKEYPNGTTRFIWI